MGWKVGDKVWWACCETKPKKETCPVCFGKLTVTLILGNGDQMIHPCDFCAPGMEKPRGYIEEYVYVAEARIVTITDIRTKQTLDKPDEHEYTSDFWHLDPHDMYTTEAEALARCAQKTVELELSRCKAKPDKSYAWNVGYHMREAKRAKEQIEYHERMAQLCKDKSKT